MSTLMYDNEDSAISALAYCIKEAMKNHLPLCQELDETAFLLTRTVNRLIDSSDKSPSNLGLDSSFFPMHAPIFFLSKKIVSNLKQEKSSDNVEFVRKLKDQHVTDVLETLMLYF